MMNAVSGISNSPELSSSANKTQLSQKDFLSMLVAQLKLQNPLNPFDASTMMQQISQLTGLSSAQSLAKSIESLKSSMGTSQLFEASHLVGKEVQLLSGSFELGDKNKATGSVLVPNAVESVQVEISDKLGNVVRKLNLNATSEGVLDFEWDGLDESGKALPQDFYKIAATSNIGGQSIKMHTAGAFKVNSVALDRETGKVILNVNGLGGVSMDELVKIM